MWEVEIRRIMVQSKTREIVHETLSHKKKTHNTGQVEWFME
jgi:hypothetical protein